MRRSISLILAAATLLIVTPGVRAAFPGDNGLIVFEAATENGIQLYETLPFRRVP
jgi:hypothetical protein